MKQVCCRRRFVSRGFGSLVELLIVVVILAVGISLYVGFMNKGGSQSIPASSVQKAEGFECQSNLRQIKTLLESEKMSSDNGVYPASLKDIAGIEKILTCPVGHKPYAYDPRTGQVHCVHPGHETY